MVTTLNIADKISVIDNHDNRLSVAYAITQDILATYNLMQEGSIGTWLIDCIVKDTLADIICNEQKVYIIELAEKCASDIAFIKHDSIEKDNFLTIARGFGNIGAFVERVVNEFELDFDTMIVTACQTASVIGYEDTLLIDDTMYVYDNGETERMLVKATFSIAYHPNYTLGNLRRRIVKRLHHKWETDIKAINIVENEDKTFTADAVFSFDYKMGLEDLKKMLEHRFGSTSGKPWYRCKVEEVEIQG
jgi:hypothetical protein